MNTMPKWMKVLFVLLLVAAAVFAVTRIPRTPKRTESPSLPSAPSKVELIRPDLQLTLEQVSGVWQLRKPVDYPANADAVKELLAGLGQISFGEKLTERAESHGLYDVSDSSGITVRVWGADKAETAWIFGKSSPNFTNIYVRFPGRPEVYLGQGIERRTLEKSLTQWRERRLVPMIEGDEIIRARVRKGRSSYVVEKSSDEWTVDGQLADKQKAQGLLFSLKAFSADDFIDPVPGDDFKEALKKYGLVSPNGEFAVKTSKGAEYRVKIGMSEKDLGRFAAQRDEETTLFWVADYHWDQVLSSAKELLPAK